MKQHTHNAFQRVSQYPEEYLQILPDGVLIPVTYEKSWQDGFGARGWKVDVTIGDPEIIASTRETGIKINTSVFIHDILDHFLSGFWISGHRSEAMALIQLAKRTNSDPRSDYKQMVIEDTLNGRVNGEDFIDFLPEQLKSLLPANHEMDNKGIITFLKRQLGERKLCDQLVNHFFILGKKGEAHAIESWKSLGLNPKKQTEIGLALQSMLTVVDKKVESDDVEKLTASITINNNRVGFTADKKYHLDTKINVASVNFISS
ncbi:MAG TPA: hypothetical protein ENJ51_06545 [Leucothrix mucor]|uniref:Uncharacterized protein n=1 Tax=Leucothrix mucor TaxID=45248 RepID=A0A7V2T2X0_LEUMU|nr:hypothetical protein [Leucothrix mucor]